MNTRALTSADLDALQPLVLESEAQGFRFLRRLSSSAAGGPHILDRADACFLGIVDHTRVVAVGGLTPDPYVPDTRVGRVRHLYVASAYRGRGLGRWLLDEIEHRAAGRYHTLRLRTDRAAAARFYVGRGYTAIADAHATHARVLVAPTHT